jgi:hypothetical protein
MRSQVTCSFAHLRPVHGRAVSCEQATVVLCPFLVARRHTPELLEPRHQALNHGALAIGALAERATTPLVLCARE